MRTPGWERRLVELLDSARTRPFAYGTWDCALFACAAIEAVTGVDYAAPFRGQYDDEASCAAVLASHGDLYQLAATVALAGHFERIRPVTAQRGDVVLGRIGETAMLGVCAGKSVAFAVAPSGVQWIPITDERLAVAWRIA